MRHLPRLLSAGGYCCSLSLPIRGTAADMKAAWRIDGIEPSCGERKVCPLWLQYSEMYHSGNRRLALLAAPGRRGNRTDRRTLFALLPLLAGDCEVVLTYQFLPDMKPPTKGYGSGVGLAVDVGAGAKKVRGDMQRVYRVGNQSGYAMHADDVEKKKGEDTFAPTDAKWGRLGLRRVKKELYFLAAEEEGELKEIGHLPFTDETVQVVRMFADQGGSTTMLDARVLRIDIRAEEITGGVPERDSASSPWWWLLLILPVVAGIGGLLFWLWQTRWRRSEDERKKKLPHARQAAA